MVVEYPILYSSAGQRLAYLDNILLDTASIQRRLNADFLFTFEALEKELKSEYLQTGNVVKVENQRFDIKYLEQGHTLEGEVKYTLEAEHVFYRLNSEDHLLPYYTFDGTPTQILNDLLSGTGFTVGTVDFTGVMTFAVSEEVTKARLVLLLAAALTGEVGFSQEGFQINLRNTIGANNGFQVRFGRNLKGVSKIVDSRQSPALTAYLVDMLELKNSQEYKAKGYGSLEVIGLGDTIRVVDEVINLNIENRIVALEYNPLLRKNTQLEIANAIELLTDKITKIERTTIAKGALYNGIRISPELGFEAIRSDGKARAYFNASNLTMQARDNPEEEWVNKIYFDPETGTYIFDGKLTVGAIQVISQTISEEYNLDDLGEMAYEDAVEKAKLGETIIEGGYLKTGFVDASRIDTGTLNANQVNIEAKDGENNVIIKLGEIDTGRYGLRITGENGELMLDEYGIDPRFIKAFKNMIWNSTFERFDPNTKIPQFWTGGEATASSSFDNTHSMKLDISQMSEQSASSGGYNPRPDPAWWDNRKTRVSFFKKGGDVQVQIFSEWDFAPYELTGEDGTQATYYNTGPSSNWDDGRYTFSFEPTKSGRVWMRFSNIGGSAAYIDAVQMEPDFNGKYPSFYTNGPFSLSAEEVPMSDTWLEYINVPYSTSISIAFNQSYSLPPTVTASLLRNVNAVNTGSSFGNHNISPNIDLIIESVGGELRYTGAHITWGGSAPGSISGGFVSVQVVGRV